MIAEYRHKLPIGIIIIRRISLAVYLRFWSGKKLIFNQQTTQTGITFHPTKYIHLLSCCLLNYMPLFVIFWQKGVGVEVGAGVEWRGSQTADAPQLRAQSVSVRIFILGSKRKGAHNVWPILGNSSSTRLVSDLTFYHFRSCVTRSDF